jgi:hypothetical protein
MDDIDPSQKVHLDVLEEEYRKRHGVAVEWLKSAVGKGDTYSNELARVTLSENGAWFECINLPMEFSGAAGGPVPNKLLSDEEFKQLTSDLINMASRVTSENTRTFGLLVLYSRAGIVDNRWAYVYQQRFAPDGTVRPPMKLGEPKPDTVPLLLRCRLDTDFALPSLGVTRGVVICLGNIGEGNLLVQIPYEGDDIRDLGATPDGRLPV